MIGKIDKQGAENQALHSVTDEVGFPTLRLVATGDIRLETLSWIEAIRRRHITGGLDMPDIPLGKRAAGCGPSLLFTIHRLLHLQISPKDEFIFENEKRSR